MSNQSKIKGNDGSIFESINRSQILDLTIQLPLEKLIDQIIQKLEEERLIFEENKKIAN